MFSLHSVEREHQIPIPVRQYIQALYRWYRPSSNWDVYLYEPQSKLLFRRNTINGRFYEWTPVSNTLEDLTWFIRRDIISITRNLGLTIEEIMADTDTPEVFVGSPLSTPVPNV